MEILSDLQASKRYIKLLSRLRLSSPTNNVQAFQITAFTATKRKTYVKIFSFVCSVFMIQ